MEVGKGEAETSGGDTRDRYGCGCGTVRDGSACIAAMELAAGAPHGLYAERLRPGETEARRRGVSRAEAGGDEFPGTEASEARNGVPEVCVPISPHGGAPKNTAEGLALERVMPLPARAGEATSQVTMRRGLRPAPQSRLAAAAAATVGVACMRQPAMMGVGVGVAATCGAGETRPPVAVVLEPTMLTPRHHCIAEMPPSSSDLCFVSLWISSCKEDFLSSRWSSSTRKSMSPCAVM